MRDGFNATAAATVAIQNIVRAYPTVSAGVVALSITGEFGKLLFQYCSKNQAVNFHC